MQKSIRQLTELTGFDRDTVKKRLDRANLAPIKSGRSHMYETRDALPALYCVIDDASLDLNAERARLAHFQANKADLEAQRAQGKLVPVEEVERHWSEMVAASRAKLLSLPQQIAQVAIAGRDIREVEAATRSVLYDALTELGKGVPPE